MHTPFVRIITLCPYRHSNMQSLLAEVIHTQASKALTRNIWKGTMNEKVADLCNDDVGKVGEIFLRTLLDKTGIPNDIDGLKTKCIGGGCGDGIVNGKSIEIKTARQGSGSSKTFQHELGEKPWLADYMLFLDIAPDKFFITLFPNFKESEYKDCVKCAPYIPSRSFCWRKKSGCFKLDTSVTIDETQAKIIDGNTFAWSSDSSYDDFKAFINRIIV